MLAAAGSGVRTHAQGDEGGWGGYAAARGGEDECLQGGTRLGDNTEERDRDETRTGQRGCAIVGFAGGGDGGVAGVEAECFAVTKIIVGDKGCRNGFDVVAIGAGGELEWELCITSEKDCFVLRIIAKG